MSLSIVYFGYNFNDKIKNMASRWMGTGQSCQWYGNESDNDNELGVDV